MIQIYSRKLWEKCLGNRHSILHFTIIFLAMVISTLLSYYSRSNLQLAPTTIFFPPGIALAAVLILGHRALIPITLGSLFSALISPIPLVVPTVLTSIIIQSLLPYVGTITLRRFQFKGTFATLKETLTFIFVIVVMALLNSIIISLAQIVAGSLSPDDAGLAWSRALVARLLSLLVITPFVISWFPRRATSLKTAPQKLGLFLSIILLVTASYFIFWTPLEQFLLFVVTVILICTLFWIALRLNIRKITLALFIVSVVALSGAFFSPQLAGVSLTEHVFSIELFLVIISPIFLAFRSLLKERDATARSLGEYLGQLEGAMQKLSAEDEAKGEFLTILAHELRNPLAAILSSAELLKVLESAHAKPQTQELLTTIMQRVKTMSILLDDLLDISRISRHKFELKKEVVALSTIIKSAVMSTETLLHSKNHTLQITESSVAILIHADVTRIEQVIINLLNNAIKYTDTGGIILLSTEKVTETIIIRVKDNGIGISANMLTQIFEPFFQIKITGRQTAGLGIGLSLTKQLVELHDGTISVKSDGPGLGSEFILHLPTSGHLSPPSPTKPTLARAVMNASQNGLRVLVVDDNEIAANSLSQLLELRGYTVAVAYNGVQAYEEAMRFKPQAAILDIGMPDLDGYEIVSLLKNESFKCVYIALTGYGQLKDKKRALYSGFDFHLTKPATLKQIEDILKKIPKISPINNTRKKKMQ